MRIFKEMNTGTKEPCPICKTKENKEVVLIPKVGTGDNPDKKFQNYEAIQVHVDCLDLWIQDDIIFQKLKKEKEKND